MDKITIFTMITMILMTQVRSINADFFWNTWDKKEEIQKEEITIDAYMAHTNTNMVLSVIKKILWSYYEAMKIFILINILEIIILISIIIAIAYAIRKIWKGRHGNDEINKEETLKQTNTAVYVNIANTSNTASGLGDNKNNNNSNGTIELRNIINRPETLENKEYISTWVKKMEIYLEAVDKQNWYKAAISFISIKLLKEIDIISIETKSIETNQENSNEIEKYETLKKQLLSMIEKDKSLAIQKIIDFKAISERKQQENETIEEYGSNLIQMAT
jgi:flagellar biogenesis protein FliO